MYRKFFAPKVSKIRYVFNDVFALLKPLWKAFLRHDRHACAICRSPFGCVIRITQKSGIIQHHKRRNNVKKLLELKVVVVADASAWHTLIVDVSEANNAILKILDLMIADIAIQGKI